MTDRLDFISFSIVQPDYSSVCVTDTFQASGTLSRSPVICGDNAGQHSKMLLNKHVYIDYNNFSPPLSVLASAQLWSRQ